MACKILCVLLVAVCAAQTMGTPVQKVKVVVKNQQPLHQLNHPRGLIGDINAAIDAVNALQDSIDALTTQINSSLVVITVDTVVQIRDILKQIQDLGISAEEIAAAEAAINQSFANIEAVFTGILDDLTNIISLLGQILTDLGNVDLVQLYQHIQDLTAAFDKLEADVMTVYSRVAAEFANIFKTIIDLTVGEPVEIVEQITQDLVNIGETWKNEATKMWTAFTSVVDAAALALQALWAIVSKTKVAHAVY